MSVRTLHPRRGPHNPLRVPASRVLCSVRRTSTIDAVRPEGLSGPVVLRGLARDLVTDADGNGRVTGRAALEVEVDFAGGRVVRAVRAEPDEPRLGALVGARAAGGFRALVAQAVPDHVEAATLLHLLLDDVPGAVLVSGHAPAAARVDLDPGGVGYRFAADRCAGWRSGGTIMAEIRRSGRPPVVVGPPAPPLRVASDPLAWHEMAELPVHGMRRSRCLDLQRDGADLLLESWFRDSHVDAGGVEEVIHEYRVSVWVDAATLRVLEVATSPHVLPFVECPLAAGSGQRLVEVPVDKLRSFVRRELTGVGTCTHLNDQYRSLADLPALLAQLPGHTTATAGE